MRIPPEKLDQPPHHFAVHIRKTTQKALSVKVPGNVFENARNKLTKRELENLIRENREKYSGAVPPQEEDDVVYAEPMDEPIRRPVLNLLPPPDPRRPVDDW